MAKVYSSLYYITEKIFHCHWVRAVNLLLTEKFLICNAVQIKAGTFATFPVIKYLTIIHRSGGKYPPLSPTLR